MKSQPNEKLTLSLDALTDESVKLDVPSIGARIKAARSAIGMTQERLAAFAGARSKSGLQDNEAGKNMPGGQMLGALVMAGVNANWLLTGSGPMLIEPYAYPQPPTKTAATVEGTAAMASTVKAARIDEDSYDSWAAGVNMANFVPVRYYSNVAISAGHGALNEGHVPDALLFRRAFLRHIDAHPRQLLLVRVRGDSMHPTLQNRWTVMIDTAKRTVDSGIYAIQSGGQEMVKRLESRPGGVVRVISDNRMYEEYEVDISRDGHDFEVIGRVIWIAGLV